MEIILDILSVMMILLIRIVIFYISLEYIFMVLFTNSNNIYKTYYLIITSLRRVNDQ